MREGRIGFKFLILFWCFKDLVADDRNNLLDELTGTKSPKVAVLYGKHEDTKQLPTNDLIPNVPPLEPPHERRAYLLYHILRTTQETEAVDPEATKKFEKTEHILREVLRSRCNNLNKCVKSCPKKKIYTCTTTCREEFDDYDVCNRPKKSCKKPRCGVTKPPYWLMLRDLNEDK